MGSKGSNTTTQNQTSTYTANPAVSGAGNQAISMAQSAASQPFNLPQAPVAGFTPDQLQAFQQYRNAQGMAQPYYDQAQGLFNQSAAPITSAQTNNYLNPYASYVLGNLKETQGQQMNDLTGRLTQAAGGVGADRIAVGQGELARQQNLATGQTLAGIYGSALGAAQQDAQRQQSAAYGIGNLGGAAQNASLQGTQALLGGGNQQQAQTQNELNSPYYNQLAAIAYPYQNAQFLAGITGGLAPAMGGTTSGQKTTTGPSPSIFSQILGAGTAAAGGLGASGAFGSNGWMTGNQSPAWYNGYAGTGDSYGGSASNPLPGLSAGDYGNTGGRVGYAEGGGVPEIFNPTQGDTSWMGKNPTIPMMDLKPSQVRPPELNWTDDKPAQQSNPMGDIANIAKFAMMFANRGGRVGYAEGGATGPYDSLGFFNANGWNDLKDNPEKFLMNNLGLGVTPWAKELGSKMGLAQGGSVYPGMGPGYAEGGDTYDDGQGPFRLDPKAYGDWQNANPLPSPDDMADDGTLPVNARPTEGKRTNRPYEMLSNAAADAAEGNAQSMNGRTLQLPYDVDHRQDVSRNFARDPWMALVAAGAGMMSGDSPFAGINIGKGLTSGVNYLGEQRKASREEEAVNQRARQLALEAEKHRDSLTKMTPYQAGQLEQQKRAQDNVETRLEQQNWQKGSENILTGETVWFKPPDQAIIVGPNGMRKATPEEAAQAIGTTGGGNTPPAQTPATPPQQQTAAEPPPLGVDTLAGNMEPKNALTNVGYLGKNSPLLSANKKENDTIIAQQAKNAAMLSPLKQGIEEMKLALKTLTKDKDADSFISQLGLQPGMNALEIDQKLNIMRTANANKIAAGQKPDFDPEKLAAAETINKVQQRLGLSYGAQLSPREAFAGQKIGIESTPGLTQSEKGLRRLLTGLEASYDEARDQQKFYQKYLEKNKGYALGWRQDFDEKNNPAKYVVRSLLNDLPEQNKKNLKEDVEILRKKPTPENIALFNKHYRDTADYFLGR